MTKKKIVFKRPGTSYQSTKTVPSKDSADERELREMRKSLTKEHGERYQYLDESCIRIVNVLPTRSATPVQRKQAYESSAFTRQLTHKELDQ